MALVMSFSECRKKSQNPHDPVECTYSFFVGPDGQKFFQLDTYGRNDRKMPGKVSQTIQFDETSGRALKKLLNEVFPD